MRKSTWEDPEKKNIQLGIKISAKNDVFVMLKHKKNAMVIVTV